MSQGFKTNGLNGFAQYEHTINNYFKIIINNLVVFEMKQFGLFEE